MVFIQSPRHIRGTCPAVPCKSVDVVGCGGVTHIKCLKIATIGSWISVVKRNTHRVRSLKSWRNKVLRRTIIRTEKETVTSISCGSFIYARMSPTHIHHAPVAHAALEVLFVGQGRSGGELGGRKEADIATVERLHTELVVGVGCQVAQGYGGFSRCGFGRPRGIAGLLELVGIARGSVGGIPRKSYALREYLAYRNLGGRQHAFHEDADVVDVQTLLAVGGIFHSDILRARREVVLILHVIPRCSSNLRVPREGRGVIGRGGIAHLESLRI